QGPESWLSLELGKQLSEARLGVIRDLSREEGHVFFGVVNVERAARYWAGVGGLALSAIVIVTPFPDGPRPSRTPAHSAPPTVARTTFPFPCRARRAAAPPAGGRLPG